GRADRRRGLAGEQLLDRVQFLNIARRGRGAVAVDVVDRTINAGQRLLHAANRAFAAGGHHVVTIRSGAVADHFTVDRRAARLRVLQLFQHDDTAAARDDKTVTGGVVRTRGLGRRVVVLARQRAHGVEQTAQRPVLFLAAAGEDDVLLAHLDQLHTVADTVRAGGARRGDRVVDALDLERRRQTGRHGRPHRLRDAV